MLKALLWKEFRELLPICVGILAANFLLAGVIVNGWRLRHAGDVWGMFPFFYLLALVVPVCIGFWQNAREDNQNTFQFLLHRPVNRGQIFGAKLLFGILVCFLLGLMPLIAFMVFANSVFPGHLSGVPADCLWPTSAGIWLLYTGAFISGLRSARWYGSRFLPLLAGIFLFIVLHMVYDVVLRDVGLSVSSSDGFLVELLSVLLATVFAMVAIHVAHTRDYS